MEYFDVCDEQGNPIGRTVSRTEAHAQGICHRTAHVWIVRKVEGRIQVLLQKRSIRKDSFPGQYDTSSAGHIQAGDEPLESALRELEEELGLRAAADELQYAGTFRIQYERMFYGKPFRDNETAFVYIYTGSVNIRMLLLQEEEVENVDWFDLEEVWHARLNNAPWLCVPKEGLQVVRDFLAAEQQPVEKLLIRKTLEVDFPQLRRIYLETRQKTFTWQNTEQFALGDFDSNTCGEKLFTAVWEGKTVGFMSVWKPESFIHCLFIDSAYQGRGIGRALLDRAAAEFPLPLALKCLQQNSRALAFYQAAGWKITQKGGEGEHAFYRMEFNGE